MTPLMTRWLLPLGFVVLVLSSGCTNQPTKVDNIRSNPDQPKGDERVKVIAPRARFNAGFPSSELDKPAINTMFLSADGSRLAISNSSAAKKRIQVWNVAGQPKQLTEQEGQIKAISPEGKRMIRWTDKELTYRVVEVDSGMKLGELSFGHNHAFFRSEDIVIGMDRSGDWSSGKEFPVYEYDATTGKKLSSKASDDDRVEICVVNQGRELVLGVEKANLIKVWDLTTRRMVREFPVADPKPDKSWYGSFVASPDGKWFAITWGYDPTKLFNGTTGKLVATLPEGINSYSIAFLPGRDVYVAPSNIAREEKMGNALDFIAYDVNKQKVVAAFRGHQKESLKLAVSADGRMMATGDEGGNVLLWDLGELK